MKMLIAMMMVVFVPQVAHAQASGSSGTKVVVLKDDTYETMDKYVVREAAPAPEEYGTPVNLPESLKEELRRALRILAVNSMVMPGPNGVNLINNDFAEDVMNSDYRLVDHIPHFCPLDEVTLKLPEGAKSAPNAACSFDKYTFLVKGVFTTDILDGNQNKFSLRDQALTIIHERLHQAPEWRKIPNLHSEIAYVIDGLEVSLRTLNLQLHISSRPSMPTLNADEVKLIELMRERLKNSYLFGKLTRSTLNLVLSSGGGLVDQRSKLAPSSYVGIGTVVANATVGISSMLIDSGWMCTQDCRIGDLVTVIGAYGIKPEKSAVLGYKVLIDHGTLDQAPTSLRLNRIDIADGSIFANTELRVFSTEKSNNGSFNIIFGKNSNMQNLGKSYFLFRSIDLTAEFGAGTLGALGAEGALNVFKVSGMGIAAVPTAALMVRDLIANVSDIPLVLKFDGEIHGDGTEKSICESGVNLFRDNLGLRAVINSREELERRCVKKSKAQRWGFIK